MTLGLKKKVVKVIKLTEEQKIARKKAIEKKINKLKNAVKIPGPINQFKTFLDKEDEKTVLDFLGKFKPETKKEKKERLSKKNPNEGPKPTLLKFGLKHIISLIEQKRLKFLMIAADVTPITTVCFLPTLCKKFGCSYAFIDMQSRLGELVHLKRSAAVGLEDVDSEHQAALENVFRIANAKYADLYETHMTTIGGNVKKVNTLE
ncbi:LSU ribosomal protein L7AE [Enterospora canceri]|uniref:60S ribosomal protein L8 n=1 Tax=Enterospora canceri TaxID=1081671 RepID=A0A1Y1S9B2_9MICR|nr:LSU ribosomal protein L7AE [Enterospora canceri]